MLTPQEHMTVSYSQPMASKIDASIKPTMKVEEATKGARAGKRIYDYIGILTSSLPLQATGIHAMGSLCGTCLTVTWSSDAGLLIGHLYLQLTEACGLPATVPCPGENLLCSSCRCRLVGASSKKPPPPLPIVYPHERLRIWCCCTCNEHFFSSRAHFLCPAELMWSLADAPVVSESHFQIVRYLVCLYYNKTLLINLAPCLMFIL